MTLNEHLHFKEVSSLIKLIIKNISQPINFFKNVWTEIYNSVSHNSSHKNHLIKLCDSGIASLLYGSYLAHTKMY